jgi:hypothetical protein
VGLIGVSNIEEVGLIGVSDIEHRHVHYVVSLVELIYMYVWV